ncbi:Beta-1,4-galactosyltransferase 4 [Hondaea fermentalgiana]|uniref:Beta-1,4-galactosyltransferase 4 n=1 Tax=Hondaea fermentalgiana TaxID=2315210 RepID=A0A2R5GHL6_9STRA|nr:Beta-1,4-galactosyltransferase 4 [Hondaea fermentalgiana]|eukprot:GBG30380.1 Beta-1,4-galactosyltransferase 4 [Hondaea fermentalgiana]
MSELGAADETKDTSRDEGEDDHRALPQGWEQCMSKSQNRIYYFQKATGKSVWTRKEVFDAERTSESDRKKRDRDASSDHVNDSDLKRSKRQGGAEDRDDRRRVAIIVPFRDLHQAQKRKEQLDKFVPHMHQFLSDNKEIASFHIFIVEQSDDGRKFNRGKLLNIGFKIAADPDHEDGPFDSFIFHDVDLLPQEALKPWYAKQPNVPLHIAKCWGRYNNNPKYFGGIVAFSRQDYTRIDGFPNTFWGWGGEDDELQKRVAAARLRIDAPRMGLPNAIVDLEAMNLKTKLDTLRKTDWKCNVKWEVQEEYNKMRGRAADVPWWGLAKLDFKEVAREKLDTHATKVTVDVLYNYNADGSEHWANRKLHWKDK